MTIIFIYCIFCYLYETGFAIATYKFKKDFSIGSILLAPIMMPIELGGTMYCLLNKR